MELKKLFTSATFLLTATSAFADTYQSEIHLDLTNAHEKLYDDEKEKGGLLSGTIFFKPVELGDHPLAEAAFLEKSSNFKFSYGYEKEESSGNFSGTYWSQDNTETPFTANFDTKKTNTVAGAKVEYYVPNTMLYLGGAIDKLDHGTRTLDKYNSPTMLIGDSYLEQYNSSATIWTASLGITPLDGLLVWSDYSGTQDEHSWSLNSKYVMNFQDHAINLEAGYTQMNGSEGIYRVAADYYIDRSFSVGAMYYSSAGDIWSDVGAKYNNDHITDLGSHTNNETYGLRAKKFFTNDVALEASFTKSDDSNKFSIGVTKRF